MIESLRIENVAIVPEAELHFGPGLNVLTGETGAGKSIVLGALALLTGARSSADAVRAGAASARVEAVFRTAELPELEGALETLGLATEGGELLVERTLARAGRSRSRVSGSLVPLGVLGELLSGWVEISSQHDSQRLLRAEEQGWLLDRAGGLVELRRALAEGFAGVRRLDAELERLRAAARERAQRRDFLAFQVQEIEGAGLDVETLAEQRAQRGRLAHAGHLRDEGAAVLGLLCGDPQAEADAAAADAVGAAAARLGPLSELDPALAGPAERLRALSDELGDVALEIERALARIEDDPGQLAALDERLHEVERLQRKYGAQPEDVLRHRDESARELAALADDDTRELEIEREREKAVAALVRSARELSDGRARAARRLGRAVQERLRELAMPRARFEIALEPIAAPEGLPCGAAGAESVEFRFGANPGEPLRPLRSVASGGELSRALLALKGAAREHASGMVLVFDEVDAGVSGRTADRVGRALAELARGHQVLCITHLPQIAALADVHFRVEKAETRGRTRAEIRRVSDDERVEEIARMAGGDRVGEATRRHARELLERSGPARP